MLLALNTGAAIAEIASLQMSDIRLGHPRGHPVRGAADGVAGGLLASDRGRNRRTQVHRVVTHVEVQPERAGRA